LLTTLTIRAVPAIRDLAAGSSSDDFAGWWPAMALLALGPAFGIYHMLRLRFMPEASKMAGGNK
jgi:hypothetical protein